MRCGLAPREYVSDGPESITCRLGRSPRTNWSNNQRLSYSTISVGTPSTRMQSCWDRMAPWVRTTTAKSTCCATWFQALQRLSGLPTEALDAAIVELTKYDLSWIRFVRTVVYELLRNGVPVQVKSAPGHPGAFSSLIGATLATTTSFSSRSSESPATSTTGAQISWASSAGSRWCSLMKASHKAWDAYTGNLRDYRETIPAIVRSNAFIILSNGSQSKIRTVSSQWEHFAGGRRSTRIRTGSRFFRKPDAPNAATRRGCWTSWRTSSPSLSSHAA